MKLNGNRTPLKPRSFCLLTTVAKSPDNGLLLHRPSTIVCPLLNPNQLNPLILTTFPLLSSILDPLSLSAKTNSEIHPKRRNPRMMEHLIYSFSASFPLTRAALPIVCFCESKKCTERVKPGSYINQIQGIHVLTLAHWRKWTGMYSAVKDVPCSPSVEYAVFQFARSQFGQRCNLLYKLRLFMRFIAYIRVNIRV